jgi:Protein of unknown function (DUF4031)
MAVYIYKFDGAYYAWYGLTADAVDELHSFAELMGLSREFYRPFRSDGVETPLVGHYELSPGDHDRAVKNGAHPISMREHKKMLGQQAALFGITVE